MSGFFLLISWQPKTDQHAVDMNVAATTSPESEHPPHSSPVAETLEPLVQDIPNPIAAHQVAPLQHLPPTGSRHNVHHVHRVTTGPAGFVH